MEVELRKKHLLQISTANFNLTKPVFGRTTWGILVVLLQCLLLIERVGKTSQSIEDPLRICSGLTVTPQCFPAMINKQAGHTEGLTPATVDTRRRELSALQWWRVGSQGLGDPCSFFQDVNLTLTSPGTVYTGMNRRLWGDTLWAYYIVGDRI